MSISVQCPGCEKKLKTKDELAGKRVKCPGCGQVILVPAAQPASEPKAINRSHGKAPVPKKAEAETPPPSRNQPPKIVAVRSIIPERTIAAQLEPGEKLLYQNCRQALRRPHHGGTWFFYPCNLYVTDNRMILQEVFPTFHLFFGAPIWVWIAWLVRKRRSLSIPISGIASLKASRKIGGKVIVLKALLGDNAKIFVTFWLSTDEDGSFFSIPWVAQLFRDTPQTSTLATVSLVLGILQLFVCGFPLMSVPSIICGHMARSQIKRSCGRLDGEGKALAGLIMGYIGAVFFVYLVVAFQMRW